MGNSDCKILGTFDSLAFFSSHYFLSAMYRSNAETVKTVCLTRRLRLILQIQQGEGFAIELPFLCDRLKVLLATCLGDTLPLLPKGLRGMDKALFPHFSPAFC